MDMGKTTTTRKTVTSTLIGGAFVFCRLPLKIRFRSSTLIIKAVGLSKPITTSLKSDDDFNYLKFHGYCEQHGFDFIMLVTGILHEKLNAASS